MPKKKKDKKERVAFLVDPDMVRDYEALAELDRRELSEVLRLALEIAKPAIQEIFQKASEVREAHMSGKPLAA